MTKQALQLQNGEGPDGPELVTMDEAAKRLGICKKTLYRMMAQGTFPEAVKLHPFSNRKRVPVADIIEFKRARLEDRGRKKRPRIEQS